MWNEEDSEDEVLAMVVRTGLYTSMGAMMRQVVYNAKPAKNLLIKVCLMTDSLFTMVAECSGVEPDSV